MDKEREERRKGDEGGGGGGENSTFRFLFKEKFLIVAFLSDSDPAFYSEIKTKTEKIVFFFQENVKRNFLKKINLFRIFLLLLSKPNFSEVV